MTIELEQEKFDTLKELAKVHENISDGRTILKELKETTEEYMVTREKEAEGRVIKVLKESSDALEEISTNHKELSKYNSELKAYAIELNTIASDIATLFEDFNKAMKIADVNMEKHRFEVAEILKATKVETTAIKSSREVLVGERAEIRDGWRLLKDRQQTLKDGFEELKKLKSNNK